MYGDFRLFENITFHVRTAVATFFGNFWKTLGYFLIQHLVTLVVNDLAHDTSLVFLTYKISKIEAEKMRNCQRRVNVCQILTSLTSKRHFPFLIFHAF